MNKIITTIILLFAVASVFATETRKVRYILANLEVGEIVGSGSSRSEALYDLLRKCGSYKEQEVSCIVTNWEKTEVVIGHGKSRVAALRDALQQCQDQRDCSRVTFKESHDNCNGELRVEVIN